MAGLTDVVSGMQNFVTALSGMSKQMSGSFTNISNQIAATAASSTAAANTAAIAAINAAYVTTIAGNSSAFTLNGASGITNTINDIKLSQGSSSQFGAVKVDGTTITAAAGVITAVSTVSIVSPSPITASTSADIALNNTANYFTGPSIAQGSSGTWFVSGTVTLIDTGATAAIYCKLWDGTTVIASAAGLNNNVLRGFPVSLSGYITNPSSNLKISCRDVDATTGKILFNQTGNSKDSTITAIRIA